MALFKPYFVSSKNLNNLPLKEGHFIFVTDTRKLYIDQGGARVEASPSLLLGNTADKAFYGDKGQILWNAYGESTKGDPNTPIYIKNGTPTPITTLSVSAGGTGVNNVEDFKKNFGIKNSSSLDTFDISTTKANGFDVERIPTVKADGKMEVGNAIDFHYDNTKKDYATRISVSENGAVNISNPITVSQVNGNASTATKLKDARTISLTGAVSGSVSFDGSANKSITTILNNFDAGKITSGTIDIARLPAGALERCVIVADDTARFKLTTANVQLGDTVKVTATNTMYMVVDDTKLNSAEGYIEYTSATATKATNDGSGQNIAGTYIKGLSASGRTITYTKGNGTTGTITTQDTTYNDATQSVHGLMSTADKTKLDGIATGATKNVASSTTPKANGTATVGTEANFARGDHVHPLQTTVSGNAGTATKLATKRTISLVGDVTGSTSFDGSADASITVTNNRRYFSMATCSTAAATAAKIITVSDSKFVLEAGSMICVKFANTNSASNVTLQIGDNGTPAKIWYNNALYTGNSNTICGLANRYIFYTWDGTNWIWSGASADLNDNTFTSAYCSTAAGTAAKVASCTGYVIKDGSTFPLNITTTNTAASALTMNINGTGAKAIYINGVASSTSNYTLPAGIYAVYYKDNIYHFRTDGITPGRFQTADQLTTARTISFSGAVTGSGTFNGSSNLAITTTVNHTHNYAGSSSAGGAATSANKLNTNAGSTSQPVYFANGVPVAIGYTIEKNVPSNAIFTDTNTMRDPATATPKANGTAAVGTSIKYAREDHVHPLQTSVHESTYAQILRGNRVSSSGLDNVLASIPDESLAYFSNVNVYDNVGMPSTSTNNANGIIGFSRHYGNYRSFLCFDNNGYINYKTVTNSEEATNGIWKKVAFIDTVVNQASALTTSAGSSTVPVYFANGVPVAVADTGVAISITGSSASCTGNATTATTASKVSQALTFNNGGSGVTSGTTYNGSTATTISYNTIGAAKSSHTHAISDITNLQSSLDSKLNTNLKGVANGVASLDSTGKVLSAQLPSFVDDVIEGYLNSGKFYTTRTGTSPNFSYSSEITGETGKIYVDLTTNKTYRWGGSSSGFVEISKSLALGETASTAYYGDKGATLYTNYGTGVTKGSSTKPIYINNGVPTQCNDTLANSISGKAATAGTADKLGTSTVGSGTKPIYLNSGTATASSSTVGSGTTPVYLNSGTITALQTELRKYHGTLASSGWKSLGGRASWAGVLASYNNDAPTWLSGRYSSTVVFGSADTKGYIDTLHSSPILTVGGGSVNNSTDDAPNWYMKFSGTSGATYTFPASSKTLAANDGSNASGSWGISITGNAATATKLQNARTINGTNFDGTAAIITANWGTARTITIGGAGKSVNGSANVAWSLAEIGAVNKAGDTVTGKLNLNGRINLPSIGDLYIRGFNTENASITISTQQSATGYHPYLKVITLNSHGFNIGGIRDQVGFWGYKAGRTENSTDWSFTVDAGTGVWTSTHPITAPTFSGNATSATKLQTARTINGTNFDGTANITTDNWGTARNINISSSDGTDAGATVSVNGSGNVTLKLPATIKATLNGNATSATKLTTSAGSTSYPVYFSDGKPVAITGTINNNAATASKLTTSAVGAADNPVYFANGIPVVTAGTLAKSISGNAETATKANSVGYFFKRGNDTTTRDIDSSKMQISMCDSNTKNRPDNLDGYCMTFNWDNSGYGSQLYMAHGGMLFHRYCNASTWGNWIKVIDSSNYTSYTVTKTGDGASGTWGINISGSSASCTGNAATATKLQTARTIGLSGGAVGAATSFDGSTNITIPITAIHPNYISEGYLDNRIYLSTHSESRCTIIPFAINDIAYNNDRGGLTIVKYDGVTQSNFNSNGFYNGKMDYINLNGSFTTATIEIICRKTFAWGNTIYIDFGADNYRAKDIQIDVMHSTLDTTWQEKGSVTNWKYGKYYVRFSHIPTNGTSSSNGFNKIRITLKNWVGTGVLDRRIAQIGVINAVSEGFQSTLLGLDGGQLFGNITLGKNNTYNLGDSTNKFANIYATTFQGNATTATTATKLGTATVGSKTKLIYLDAGAPAVSDANVGSETKPVYLKNGILSVCSRDIPDGVTLSAAGSDKQPVYINSSGVPKACIAYSEASVKYATSAGTATKLGSSTVGSVKKLIYLDGGTPTASNATVGAEDRLIYMDLGTLKASTAYVGDSRTPIYMSNGTLKPCGSLSASKATNAEYADRAENIYGRGEYKPGDNCYLMWTEHNSTGYRQCNTNSDIRTKANASYGEIWVGNKTQGRLWMRGSGSGGHYLVSNSTSNLSYTVSFPAKSYSPANLASEVTYDEDGNIIPSEEPINLGTLTYITENTQHPSNQPVYVSESEIIPMTDTIGSDSAPMYLDGGEFRRATDIEATKVTIDSAMLDISNNGEEVAMRNNEQMIFSLPLIKETPSIYDVTTGGANLAASKLLNFYTQPNEGYSVLEVGAPVIDNLDEYGINEESLGALNLSGGKYGQTTLYAGTNESLVIGSERGANNKGGIVFSDYTTGEDYRIPIVKYGYSFNPDTDLLNAPIGSVYYEIEQTGSKWKKIVNTYVKTE